MGIIFFPSIFFLEFKSKVEMELMPQSVEEHIQQLDIASSASGSYTSIASGEHTVSHANVLLALGLLSSKFSI